MPKIIHACIKQAAVNFINTVLLLLCASNAHASETAEAKHAWARFQEGTAVAIMRHALAPGTGDPTDFVVDDCSTQRNLSSAGRAQANNIGAMFRKNGITNPQIFTSEWCRCQQTAQMLNLGEPTIFSPLNSFYQDRSTSQDQTARLRDALPDWMQKGSRPTLLVTHQVNISALTGNFTSSGEVLIISLNGDDVVVLASIANPN